MTLNEHYLSLPEANFPQKNFREQIMKLCKFSAATFYRMLKGDYMPSPAEKEAIAKIVGKEVEELFPENEPAV